MASAPVSAPSRPEGAAADWEGIWKDLPPKTRFDVGEVHSLHRKLIEEGKVPNGRALVPGCGRGYDVAALASKDRFAVGLEYAPTAAEAARQWIAGALGPESSGQWAMQDGDFFQYKPAESSGDKFDYIYDYTFLCAILPERRKQWAQQMQQLLKPGGRLLTLQFPLKPYPVGQPEDLTRGPPFQLSKQLYEELLLPLGFKKLEEGDVPAEMSPPARAGMEGYALWSLEGPLEG